MSYDFHGARQGFFCVEPMVILEICCTQPFENSHDAAFNDRIDLARYSKALKQLILSVAGPPHFGV